MINKVNRPSFLKLIRGSSAPKNDPGSSQGGGNAYESLPESPEQNEEKHSEPLPESVVADQIGLTSVVLEFRSGSSPEKTQPSAHKYPSAQSSARGMLLNKKAE